MNVENISNFISAVNRSSGFLPGNRYRVVINKLNSANFSLFCSKVDLPGIDYVQADFDIGGKMLHTPSKVSLGDLQLTFYNTGKELKAFYQYCDNNVYNNNTHAVGYYDDVAMNISVYEYNRHGSLIITREYSKCIIKSISPLSLSYNESTEVQNFTIGFSCSNVKVS